MLKHFKKFAVCILCLSCAFVAKAECWWDVSHMIIVQIAKEQLDPVTISHAEQGSY